MINLEHLYTSDDGFGVPASPAQRAICRIVEGTPLGDLATHPDVLEMLGGPEAVAAIAGSPRPLEVDWLSGIRTGKSRLAAALAVFASQTVDVSHLTPGEVPRVSIVSLRIDSAQVVLDHLVGTLTASRTLRGLVIGEPVSDGVMLRHPSGRPIEVKVVAGARAGGTLVSRWSAGAVFDEFTRMASSDDGSVVNYDDARRAVLGRLLPGAQAISIGSPWAPIGPAYERCHSRFGKPGADHVVIRTKGPIANPSWWTTERCAALLASDPTAHRTDVECEFADPSTATILQSDIKAATRIDGPAVLAPMGAARLYVAAMDPGTRGNAWTLALLSAYENKDSVVRYDVVLARQWIGSSAVPLSPSVTLAAIAETLAPYGIRRVFSDQNCADAYREIGARFGLEVITKNTTAGARPHDRPYNANAVYQVDMYTAVGEAFASRTITIPDDRPLVQDLLGIRKVVTRLGIAFDLPKIGGRHCDYAPALALAMTMTPRAGDLISQARRAERAKESARIGAYLSGGFGAVAEVDLENGDDLRNKLRRLRAERGAETGLTAADAHAWNRLLQGVPDEGSPRRRDDSPIG